jgi:hypothetical protein
LPPTKSKLTLDEFDVAIERARKYPPGFGFSYIGKNVSEEDVLRAGLRVDDMLTDEPALGMPGIAAQWLQTFPEDVEFG